jgi:anthranilate phosphoribosyltransferase
MQALLNRLYEHDTLARDEARQLLLEISHGQHHHLQVAALTAVYNMRPISMAELQGFRDALLELCVPLDLGGMDTLDIVGTGGDGKNTFNISTLAAVVIAGAGYKVSKHGSYGVSSAVGSSNVLLALGYAFTDDQDQLRREVEKANLCFLHAPLFHPALKEVVPVRKALQTKTFFNMLGPLVNPLQPRYQLFGTFSMELARMYHYIMQHSGRRFVIVHAIDGYDEISLTGDCKVRTNDTERVYTPTDFGARRVDCQELYGGHTPEEAADLFRNVLQDKATTAQKQVVIANAGMAIHLMRPDQSLDACLAEARESIESGAALDKFKTLLSLQ